MKVGAHPLRHLTQDRVGGPDMDQDRADRDRAMVRDRVDTDQEAAGRVWVRAADVAQAGRVWVRAVGVGQAGRVRVKPVGVDQADRAWVRAVDRVQIRVDQHAPKRYLRRQGDRVASERVDTQGR